METPGFAIVETAFPLLVDVDLLLGRFGVSVLLVRCFSKGKRREPSKRPPVFGFAQAKGWLLSLFLPLRGWVEAPTPEKYVEFKLFGTMLESTGYPKNSGNLLRQL